MNSARGVHRGEFGEWKNHIRSFGVEATAGKLDQQRRLAPLGGTGTDSIWISPKAPRLRGIGRTGHDPSRCAKNK